MGWCLDLNLLRERLMEYDYVQITMDADELEDALSEDSGCEIEIEPSWEKLRVVLYKNDSVVLREDLIVVLQNVLGKENINNVTLNEDNEIVLDIKKEYLTHE